MDISAAALFETYGLASKLAGQFPELTEKFKPIQGQFEDKRSQPDASIMVYGVYNAGKSTLINALIGEEVAATGDIPLTDRVDAYSWNNTLILDTPGVDAPLAHEKVTREQMLKADAIIFVANPSGAAEEEKTLQVLIEILQAKKQLFLVLNEKDKMDVEEFTRLKNDLRSRLQVLAKEKGMQEVLHNIPILRVNAEMALQAKRENIDGLLKLSAFPAFEDALKNFIAGIDNQAIYRRLSSELSRFLDNLLETLGQKTTSETVRGYDALLKNIVEQQHLCRKTIVDEIKRQRDVMYRGSKAALRQAPEQAQAKIEALFIQASGQVEAVQRQETDYLVQRFQDDVETLEDAILRQAQVTATQDIPQKPGEKTAAEPGAGDAKHGLNAEMVNHAVTSLGSLAKPEHVVTGLKLVKDWLPSLMKGIGPKTMEKWGAAVVGKWIPYVGPAITVISSLWDIFAEDSESKQAREQSEQQRREWERYQQEVDDFAHTTAAQFEANAMQLINEVLTPWFKEVVDKVKASRNIASSQDKAIGDAQLEAQRLSLQLRDMA
ncbi:dynamin family protein [Pectobacterium aroidearum]|uniref:Dynamin family protein n=1 Tax=Pectobacterium aroidearum TaxID=1201031 RepID=A0ABR5ZBF3_9GAMM|nr:MULTISPECIES: dynamin family protein [Pectobacterium]MBA5199097.1 dynamin family protein [Pectobacterium aroidearum]MBA5226424.1 dynamin family protein [Pectobacterium aroidearum]MBA5231889.1 dynamin family protein [Pectobacterium aroidearum]MBA5737053.1 dynamin family protein [Pectobacterium aroidearum]UXJ99103.1 dynamin family protein [Pectobacterium aroidearum]